MWRRGDPAATQLVAECEAFLSGRYADDLMEAHEAVPAWTWLNLLAHGSEAELRGAASAGAVMLSNWSRARSFLAGEVLDRVDIGAVTLDALQRDVLIPLELDLAAHDPRWLRPSQLVAAVLEALPDRSTRRHR